MTIRKKITLWYTAFMALFVVLALCFLFVMASGRILSDTRTRLKETVLSSFGEIEYEDGVLTFDDDSTETLEGDKKVGEDNGGMNCFLEAEASIRVDSVSGVKTCALAVE